MKPQKKIRSFAAAALADPRFKPRVAQTSKPDAKASRRAWKNKNAY